MAKKKVQLFRAEIEDDNGDTTYGPAETYEEAIKRRDDAMSARWNIKGSVQEVK